MADKSAIDIRGWVPTDVEHYRVVFRPGPDMDRWRWIYAGLAAVTGILLLACLRHPLCLLICLPLWAIAVVLIVGIRCQRLEFRKDMRRLRTIVQSRGLFRAHYETFPLGDSALTLSRHRHYDSAQGRPESTTEWTLEIRGRKPMTIHVGYDYQHRSDDIAPFDVKWMAECLSDIFGAPVEIEDWGAAK